MTPLPQPSQFSQDEAMAMIEFCIDLDNQDDRAVPNSRSIYKVRADRFAGWQPIDDSRVRFARARGLDGANGLNPAMNGFPPFGSAWTLWQKAGTALFAIAFRGTVFSFRPSVVEDSLVTTIAGQHGLELPAGEFLSMTFSTQPRAEVHEGFAYALLGQLFDRDFGALARVKALVPPGATLIITGHSQGAALATLAHAFFAYAAAEARFGVAELSLKLRSYVFAQPKPGNAQFSQDFAALTGAGAASFVFNNTIDPVPMVPPTHGFLFGAFEDNPQTKNPGWRFVRMINNAANQFSRAMGSFSERKTAGKIAALQKQGKEGLYMAEALRAPPGAVPESAVSQNYAPAGCVIPLRGELDGSRYYGNAADMVDEFIQHHATTYRRLMETLYGLPSTVEGSPELALPPVVSLPS